MMKKRWSVILSLGFGIACAFAVGQFLDHVEDQANMARAEAMERYGGEQVQVIVATSDIAPGDEVTASNTAARMWLVEMVPDQAVYERSQIAGRKATTGIKSGEVLNLSRFKEEEEDESVPAGMCGVGVEVQDSQTASSALNEGSKVDVYAVTQDKVRRICVSAPVISSESSSGHAYWVTLAVRPSQVQDVLSASKNSSLYLVLPGESVSQSDYPVKDHGESADGRSEHDAQEGAASHETSHDVSDATPREAAQDAKGAA